MKIADAAGTYIAPDGTFRETTQWGAPSDTHRTNVPSAAQQCLLLTSGPPFRAWSGIRTSARSRSQRYAVPPYTFSVLKWRVRCSDSSDC